MLAAGVHLAEDALAFAAVEMGDLLSLKTQSVTGRGTKGGPGTHDDVVLERGDGSELGDEKRRDTCTYPASELGALAADRDSG